MIRKVYKILSFGGIGDALLTTPIFRTLKASDPDCKVKVYCTIGSHIDIYKGNPYVDDLIRASFWSMPIERIIYSVSPRWIEKKFFINAYGRYNPCKVYKIHASNIIAEMMDIKLIDLTPQVFLTEAEKTKAKGILNQYNKPIIVHTTTNTSKNQHWPVRNWEELIRVMPGYTFIQLGLRSDEKIDGAIDFRGKSSIRGSIAMIKYAVSFVGIDSSLAHAAKAVGVPGVILFGPSTPAIWGHKGHVNLFENVSCSPCIDLLMSSSCPYGGTCMQRITVENVKFALEGQIARRLRFL